MTFKKAVKKQRKLKIAIAGPSGAGKTYSALRLASGLGKKIAVIDSENESSSMYADKFNFDVCPISAPYTPEKYWNAIKEAVKAGYDVVICDSLTHEWSGTGGLLEYKEQLDSRPKSNKFANWAVISKQHNAFIAAIVDAPIHFIGTLRSKTEYAQTDEDGKKTVKKIGSAPIQRDGFEYEFDILFDVQMNHECDASKDRTGIFTDRIFKITEEAGHEILSWLETTVQETPATPGKPKINIPVEIFNHLKSCKINESEMKNVLAKIFSVNSFKELTESHYQEYLMILDLGISILDEYNSRIETEKDTLTNVFDLSEPFPESGTIQETTEVKIQAQEQKPFILNEAFSSYAIKTGKFCGMILKDCTPRDLLRYIKNMELFFKENNIEPSGATVEDLQSIKNYIIYTE